MLVSEAFVPAPQANQNPAFNTAVAASAAFPAMTMLADPAAAKFGQEIKRWEIILLPLTTLVIPAVAMGAFTLYSFEEDAFWQLTPGSKKSLAVQKAWRNYPMTANTRDPLNGLIDRDDYERGLEEAWEKAKPAGSTVTVKDKFKQLSTQNSPHSVCTKAIYMPESA